MAKSVKSAAQQERLAAALRENLKRRKAAARSPAGRDADEQAKDEAPAPDTSPARPNKAANPH